MYVRMYVYVSNNSDFRGFYKMRGTHTCVNHLTGKIFFTRSVIINIPNWKIHYLNLQQCRRNHNEGLCVKYGWKKSVVYPSVRSHNQY